MASTLPVINNVPAGAGLEAEAPWCFDPVQDLPGDLAAICLSFVGVDSLIRDAQFVSRAWRDAIDGGLPAAWHEACHSLTDAKQLMRVRGSHPCIRELQLHGAATWTACDLSLPNLRVLHITPPDGFKARRGFLSSFPLLQDLSVMRDWMQTSCLVELPPLQHLATANFKYCIVQGVPNLPALTKLTMNESADDYNATWPTSLRELTIYRHPYDPQILERIAALQQLVLLATDWSFALRDRSTLFRPPYDQLAFLADFTTLQRFELKTNGMLFPVGSVLINNHCLGAIASLRELSLYGMYITDKDMQCVQRLTNLQRVKLRRIRHITNHSIRYVCTLPKLAHLVVAECGGITDFAMIGVCAQLRELKLQIVSVSPAHIRALIHLRYLEKLTVDAWFDDPTHIMSLICRIRSLRELGFGHQNLPIPVSAFSALPALTSLEKVRVARVAYDYLFRVDFVDVPQLVDYLVQMPRLRHVCFLGAVFDAYQQSRLRNALPKLETIADCW